MLNLQGFISIENIYLISTEPHVFPHSVFYNNIVYPKLQWMPHLETRVPLRAVQSSHSTYLNEAATRRRPHGPWLSPLTSPGMWQPTWRCVYKPVRNSTVGYYMHTSTCTFIPTSMPTSISHLPLLSIFTIASKYEVLRTLNLYSVLRGTQQLPATPRYPPTEASTALFCQVQQPNATPCMVVHFSICT